MQFIAVVEKKMFSNFEKYVSVFDMNEIFISRIHTRERLYCCEFCSKNFFSNKILNKHEQIHKKKQNEISAASKI